MVGKITGLLAYLCIAVSVTAGIAGCTAGNRNAAETAAQATQAITSPAPVNSPAATEPVVMAIRPIIQTVGNSLPFGQQSLSLIAGIAGLVVGVLQTIDKTRKVNAAGKAVAELSAALPPTVSPAGLSPATRKQILIHTT